MLQALKRYSAKKQMASFLEKDHWKETGQNKKIGIIIELDVLPQNFDLAEMRKELNVEHKDFHPIFFTRQKNLPEKYSLNAFNAKRLGWKAVFEEGNERNFANVAYDLLLNYFVNPSPELLILSASVKAKLKIGFPLEEKRLNDLELLVDPKDFRLFVSELKKYLNAII